MKCNSDIYMWTRLSQERWGREKKGQRQKYPLKKNQNQQKILRAGHTFFSAFSRSPSYLAPVAILDRDHWEVHMMPCPKSEAVQAGVSHQSLVLARNSAWGFQPAKLHPQASAFCRVQSR